MHVPRPFLLAFVRAPGALAYLTPLATLHSPLLRGPTIHHPDRQMTLLKSLNNALDIVLATDPTVRTVPARITVLVVLSSFRLHVHNERFRADLTILRPFVDFRPRSLARMWPLEGCSAPQWTCGTATVASGSSTRRCLSKASSGSASVRQRRHYFWTISRAFSRLPYHPTHACDVLVPVLIGC